MSDVVVGAILGLVASLLTTVVIKRMDWSRENQTRWDKDILTIATEALIAAERAKGRIYAWSKGEFESIPGRSRPEIVDDEIDRAYYRVKSLAILFPKLEPEVEELQGQINSLARATSAYRKELDKPGVDPEACRLEYETAAAAHRVEIDRIGEALLDAVQVRLRVDGSG